MLDSIFKQVQSVLQDYLPHTRLQNANTITLQIIKCPPLIALACLAKQNNVFADLAAQDLLRQGIAWLNQELSSTDLIDFSAVPSAIPAVDLLNVPASTQARLRVMVMCLFKITVEKAKLVEG